VPAEADLLAERVDEPGGVGGEAATQDGGQCLLRGHDGRVRRAGGRVVRQAHEAAVEHGDRVRVGARSTLAERQVLRPQRRDTPLVVEQQG
jgi:hypothetical protein